MSSVRPNSTASHDEEDPPQNTSEKSAKLTEFEQVVYDFVKAHEAILTSNIPRRMRGAIPDLKNKGVIEVFKKRTSRWASKKRKFVKVRRNSS